LLKTALTAKLTTKGVELKSWNHTPELKIIKLPKNEGGEDFFFTTSVERVRVKPKTAYTMSVRKFLEEK